MGNFSPYDPKPRYDLGSLENQGWSTKKPLSCSVYFFLFPSLPVTFATDRNQCRLPDITAIGKLFGCTRFNFVLVNISKAKKNLISPKK